MTDGAERPGENRPPPPAPARVVASVTADLGEDPGPEELMPGPRGDGLTFEGASCGGPWPGRGIRRTTSKTPAEVASGFDNDSNSLLLQDSPH